MLPNMSYSLNKDTVGNFFSVSVEGLFDLDSSEQPGREHKFLDVFEQTSLFYPLWEF